MKEKKIEQEEKSGAVKTEEEESNGQWLNKIVIN